MSSIAVNSNNLTWYENSIGDPVEHLIDFKSKLILHARDGALIYELYQSAL